jgi:MinD-like ATPase involved in chromosome partitioning or flagellar assembly
MLASNAASRDLAELTARVQIPLSTGRRIAVTSVRGGAGKSTVAMLLALVYAARRADPVLAADADPDGGSLPWRLGLAQCQPLSVLAPRLLTARSGDLRGLERWLPRTANGLWVLPGGAAGQPRLARDVTRALSRLFGVCVTDCGRGVDEPSTVEILSEAHGVIVVAPATPDGVRATCAVLGRVPARQAGSLSRVVVALNAVTRDSALRSSAALEALGQFGVPLVSIPYDRHVAGGAPITPSRIGEATLVEATRLAGHALARAWQL